MRIRFSFQPVWLLPLCAVLFFYALGTSGLLDPDEPFYALTAREMVRSGDWSTPRLFGAPQFEKPIFFYWVLAASNRLFGDAEWVWRAGSALAATATVFIVYAWGMLVYRRRRAAFLGALVLATSGIFIAHARLVLTDSCVVLFSTAALFCFAKGRVEASARPVWWRLFFVFLALGFLTKGPLGALLPELSVGLFLIYGGGPSWRELPWKSGLAIFAAIAAPWYVYETARHGGAFLWDFFIHENVRRIFIAEHPKSNHPLFYPAVLFAGIFPWCAFVFPALVRSVRSASRRKDARAFALFAFAAPLLALTPAQSKLASYVMPALPPLALLTGAYLDEVLVLRKKRAWAVACAASLSVLLTAAVYGWILPSLDGKYTSRRIGRELARILPPGETLLSSKMYFRGIAFYRDSGETAVVIGDKKRGFYTPPAVRLLSDGADLASVGVPAYGVLRPKEFRQLEGMILGRGLELTVVKDAPGKIFFKMEKA